MTVRVCATASVPADASSSDRLAVCEALGRLAEVVPEISHAHVGLHLEGSLGAGDLTWDFAADDAEALERLGRRLEDGGWEGLFGASAPADAAQLRRVSNIEAWRIEPLDQRVPHDGLAGIKRTNLVRVLDNARAEDVQTWSRDVVALATHVPAIRNWSLARTDPFGPSSPRIAWTHAWEQEFETLEGLLEDYMTSAYHWGWLDGWYDPEMPQCIIDPDLAHLYCPATTSVLGWAGHAHATP